MNIKGSTHIYGVMGYPIEHSLSPVFQNAAFNHLGIDAVYIPFEVQPEGFIDTIKYLKNVGNLKGLNVTIPHKEFALSVSDEVSDEAKEIGAANTLVFDGEKIYAHNTDWIGFTRAVSLLTDLGGKKVLVLGAGGASKAVLYALKRAGASVFLWNRTHDKALKLAKSFSAYPISSPEEVLGEVELIVNTTSAGLKEGDPPLFSYELISERHVVIDIIYKETPLIEAAKKKGCMYQTGFPMLIHQGAESFRIWTGCEPPVRVMEMSLKDYGYPIESSKTHRQTL